MTVQVGDYESILSGGVGHSGGEIPNFSEVLTRGHWVDNAFFKFTADFIAAATADIRCPMAMVEITWAKSSVDFNQVISSNDINRVDRTGQLFNDETESGEKWAYIHSGLIADGSFHAMPELDSEAQAGWYGSALIGDGSGDFSTEPYLEVAHTARAYTDIVVAGDSGYGEYPVDFDITFTHTSGPTVIQVTGNTAMVYENTFTAIKDVTAVKLSISKWSAPNTIVKITQFAGSLISLYGADDIVELSILEETNSDTGVVPIGNVSSNELDLSLLNTERRFSFGNTDSEFNSSLISGRKIRVWLGFVLPSGTSDVTGDMPGYIVNTVNGDKVGYMPYGVYWSNDWISDYGSQVTTTTAYDVAYLLSQKEFLRSVNYSGNATSIINEVMAEALIDVPELEWVVDGGIASEVWGNVSFRTASYLDILKGIAEATLSYTYVNREGVLVIGSRLAADLPLQSWQELDLSKYFSFESAPKLDEVINFIRVGYSKYNVGEADQDIYSDSETFTIPVGATELELFIAWKTQPVDVSTVAVSLTAVSGEPLITTANIYANGAGLVITGIAGDSFTLGAVGTPYEIEENTETTAENAASISLYGKREFALTGNMLITTVEQAKSLAESLLSFYGALRNDASIDWPSSTLLAVGDTLEVVEFKSDTVETKDNFLIKRQTTIYNGSIQAQTELRRG